MLNYQTKVFLKDKTLGVSIGPVFKSLKEAVDYGQALEYAFNHIVDSTPIVTTGDVTHKFCGNHLISLHEEK